MIVTVELPAPGLLWTRWATLAHAREPAWCPSWTALLDPTVAYRSTT